MCSECPWSVFVNNTLITRNTLQSSVQTCDSCHRAEMWWPAKNGEMKMIKCPTNISLPTRRLFLLIFTGCDPDNVCVLWLWGEWRPLVRTLWSVSVSGLISGCRRPPIVPSAGDSWSPCQWLLTRDMWLCHDPLIETLQSSDISQLSPPAQYCHSRHQDSELGSVICNPEVINVLAPHLSPVFS